MAPQEITSQQLKAISKYTRREIEPDQLFVFSMVLCDNEVDRQGERFNTESLNKLAKLYVGKTGVFDHEPKAEGQSARIFDTEVVSSNNKNSIGRGYKMLKAWAYMVRCEKNSDLILEIDAGIKKEVSVGCAVEQVVCSVCGSNQKTAPCSHIKGESYKGVGCHHLLLNPTDAYEWSFVAVPAQRNAGITKNYKGIPKEINRLITQNKGYSPNEATALQKYIGELTLLAKAGEEYTQKLKRETIANAGVTQPEMDFKVLEDVLELMTIDQLKVFHGVYEKMSIKKKGVALQLQPLEEYTTQESFKI